MVGDVVLPNLTNAELTAQLAAICHTETLDRSALQAVIQTQLPDLTVRHVLTRGGWHRIGGVVDLDGQRIAHHLADWANAESGGDVDELLGKLIDQRYFATRLNGQTHYLIAQTGARASEFLQIEIEELQEVLDRCLTDPDWFPDSVAEFIDPLDFPRLEPEPIGTPRLVFRRVVQIAEVLASGDASPRLKRFISDWEQSSASEAEPFCHHWVLALREYQDREGERHLTGKPVAVLNAPLPSLPDAEVARGAALANQIHSFDRAVGYPFAWYFHMLTNRKVSYQLAEAVHTDLMGAYAYLPARDLRVLRDWYREPYSV